MDLQRDDYVVVKENHTARWGGCPVAEPGDLVRVRKAHVPRTLPNAGETSEGVLFVVGHTVRGRSIADWITFEKLETATGALVPGAGVP